MGAVLREHGFKTKILEKEIRVIGVHNYIKRIHNCNKKEWLQKARNIYPFLFSMYAIKFHDGILCSYPSN
jgi:hypothetical protein